MTTIIEFKDVCKTYNHKDYVIKNLNLKINKAKKTAIIGKSGAGKTTLLRMLNGLEMPTSGEIIVDKEVKICKKNLEKVRHKVGFVFQNFNLFPNMNVVENLIFNPVKILGLNKQEQTQVALKLLQDFDIHKLAKKHPHQISGGQKQRVAICRSLMTNPTIIAMDEPTSALDPKSINQVIEAIEIMSQKDITVVCVTHQMNFVSKVFDDLVILSHGEAIYHAKVEEIFNSKDEEVKQYIKEFEM